jgi:uncharacterized protein with HEPN domain
METEDYVFCGWLMYTICFILTMIFREFRDGIAYSVTYVISTAIIIEFLKNRFSKKPENSPELPYKASAAMRERIFGGDKGNEGSN